ncbi:transcription elongation factor spt5 [Pleurotus ostreatus]|uniref:Transcription elongation factor spt5 n=1 Tax=Pleurotus ostreatus TaxID=5322 RepID=A0A8H7DNT2_PLEOS|nr:transcription elongation factor spt5 [Pleurotus ostreatus]KAF7425019.1 transcription elongation factor spt5 [Pleurotus ostreatus]
MRPYRDILAFLDIEAGVENSDDDDDHDDIDTDSFISDEPETPSSHLITNRHHTDPLEFWNTDAESMVNAIVDQRKKHTDGWKATVAYLPSITDGDIWKVAVTPGCELSVVTTIFNKVSALKIDGVDSAFYREGISGVVYVEARNYGAALTVLMGINNVWLRYYKAEGGPVDLVPISERLALLSMVKNFVSEVEKPANEQQRFVRIRDRTRYRHNLGIIVNYNMDARHALVLVVPRELTGTRRRLAAPPVLKMDPSVKEGGPSSDRALFTSDGIGNLETVSSDGQYLSGLEVRRIDVDQLVYHDIHPTAHELDMFEATGHTEICKFVNQARDLQIRQGEKFEVTQGPWKGFKGIVEEGVATDPALSVRMKGRYWWEDVEVPKEDLAYAGPQGSTTTVIAGPYTGLKGRICKYLHHTTVISPDTDAEQTIDVRVSDVQRTVDLGDEVEIILGTLKGRSGFYVGVDEAKARIYLDEPANARGKEAQQAIGRMVSIPFGCIRTPPDTRNARIIAQCSQSGPTPFQLPPNTRNPQDIQAMYTGDPFRGLEVVIVDHPLKGYEGYVVGSCLVNPPNDSNSNGGDDRSMEDTEDTAILEFEVNKLNNITCFTARLSARHLQEKYSKLPIMEAIHLPPHLRAPDPASPVPMAMTPCPDIDRSESSWPEVTHEYTRDVTSAAHRFTHHWLRNPVMMHKKFQILILHTLFDDGSYRTDNAASGYTVVTEALDRWSERIFVKMGEERNLTTKKILLKKIIPDNRFLRHSERVIVIGEDMAGNDYMIGMVGWVNESPYALDEGVQLVALAESPGFAYVREVNLCRTGAPALWKGALYN